MLQELHTIFKGLANPDSHWWNVVNALGAWAAAIGTVFTGFVALWLASRDRRIDLQLAATIGSDELRWMTGEPDLLFSVRNAGHRNVTITAIGFTIGIFPWMPPWCGLLHRGGFPILPDQLRPKVRTALADGETMDHAVQYRPWVFNLADALPCPYFLSQWTIRFWALTSVDMVVSKRVSPRLRRRIVRAARRPRA
jgi:hypothetical protein